VVCPLWPSLISNKLAYLLKRLQIGRVLSLLLVRTSNAATMKPWILIVSRLDTVETYFDSHVDLLQRKLQKHSDRLKMKAEELKMKDLSTDALAENFEREYKGLKVKVCTQSLLLFRVSSTRQGFRSYNRSLCLLEVCQSRQNTREGLVLCWCHDSPLLRTHVWAGTRVRHI
jgi:hypothetical protein